MIDEDEEEEEEDDDDDKEDEDFTAKTAARSTSKRRLPLGIAEQGHQKYGRLLNPEVERSGRTSKAMSTVSLNKGRERAMASMLLLLLL